MSTIGLDKLYFADITEAAETAYETYGSPYAAPGVQQANFNINVAESKNYADDDVFELVKEFVDGTITLQVAELGTALAAKLTGARVDGNGVLLSSDDDAAPPVAVGFRSMRADHTYEYVWLYRVVFGVPKHDYQTKGESVSFQNSTIEGTISRRKKPDVASKTPWRAQGNPGSVSAAVLEDWFDAVYEPVAVSSTPAVTEPAVTGGT